MALIAAGRLADDEQRAEIGLGVASHFSEQRLADRFGFVGGDALFAGGQDMNDETVLGDFERNDVIECRQSRVHSHGGDSVILDCMRPSKALLPFGWTWNSAAQAKIALDRVGSSRDTAARRP